MDTLTLGTRGSALALYQANTVAALLRDRTGVDCEVVVIRTTGDRLAEARLSEVGGKGVFVKEIEDALLDGRIDLAVHSSKDMPAVLPEGLAIGAVLPREDPRDALVFPAAAAPVASIEDAVARLGDGGRVGTSSVRRVAQLARVFPGARFLPIRGNLDTRLRKLERGEFDTIVLAAAGLRRLGQATRIALAIPPALCVPSPGQGLIAVERRADDPHVRDLIARLDDPAGAAALAAERAVVRRLGGGCQMPIGALATQDEQGLHLDAIVLSLDGTRVVRAASDGPARDADALGVRVAERLLADGAAALLAEVERAHTGVGPGTP